MTDDNYLQRLNDAQRAAVEYLGGPELVIAGAGSGKTRVLTYKIVHLLHNGHYPNRILALTFTNKAAREMRERIGTLVGDEVASKLWMGTFHSIFSRILRRHADRLGYKSNFTIYDAADSKSLVKSIIKDMQLDDKYYRPTQVAADISWAKNQLLSPEEYAADRELVAADEHARRGRLHEIYATYCERCRIAGAMDFDDLLYFTNVLLRDNPDVLDFYRGYFSYILVDEYQDTNFAQHAIVRQLAGQSEALCVVGDDAQSIYSFRGANIQNILELKRSFPKLATFKLEQNYRSTRNIIAAAGSLIAANKDQIPKDVFSKNADGDRIEVVQSFNEYEEAYAVVSRLQQVRRRMSLPYSEIAILYRTNAQSRVLEEALRTRNIPYRIYGGLAFYQRKEIRDAIAYFRLCVNPDDDEALSRVINTPKRGIGDTTIAKVRAAAVEHRVSMYAALQNPELCGLEVNRGTLAKLKGFAALVDRLVEKARSVDADALTSFVIAETGLLAEYVQGDTPECVSKRENLMELCNGVKAWTEEHQKNGEAASMAEYLSEISLMTDQDSELGDDAVTLMTIHSAKGLEYGAVFVVGVEENLLPSDKCRTPAEIEEERRLMYVAITRAKQFCMISYARKRTVNGQSNEVMPSRFIADIDSRYLQAVGGTRLEKPHPRPVRPVFQPVATVFKPAPEPTRVGATIGASPAPATPKSTANDEFPLHMASELRTGQRIMHSSFGAGVIETVDTATADHRITVNFSSKGHKTLLLKYAKFKLLS